MEDSNYDISPELEERKKKLSGKSKRMRNLGQYKDFSDEEFVEAMEKREGTLGTSREFEEQIEKKLDEFEEDYDLSDLKINDKYTLRALIQALISLEDYEQRLYEIRKPGVTGNTLLAIEKFQKAMSDLRADIVKFQQELNISRKSRKSDKDVSVLEYIKDLNQKAKTFYENKASYIFCPKCNMLLGTLWTQFPLNDKNKIALVCERTLGDGSKCGEKVIIGTRELLKNRGTNNPEITPESML